MVESGIFPLLLRTGVVRTELPLLNCGGLNYVRIPSEVQVRDWSVPFVSKTGKVSGGRRT